MQEQECLRNWGDYTLIGGTGNWELGTGNRGTGESKVWRAAIGGMCSECELLGRAVHRFVTTFCEAPRFLNCFVISPIWTVRPYAELSGKAARRS
jgi:hypothetical protein